MADHVVVCAGLWGRMIAEMAGAVAVDPTLITQSVDAMMDVDIGDSADYGRAHVWKADLAPKGAGLRPVTIIQQIDTTRFLDVFVAAAQALPKP